MLRSLSMFHPIVNILFLSNIPTAESVSCSPKNGIYEGVKYTGTDFKSEIHNIGPFRCFQECSLFKECTFVNYDKMRFICYLFNTEFIETSVELDDGFAILHNVSLNEKTTGHCLNHKCKNGEQCVQLRNSSICFKRSVSGCRHKQYLLDDNTRTCYRVVDTINLTWSNAEQFCRNDNGHLIALALREKNNFISIVLQRFNPIPYWFGLHDRAAEGNFVWLDGTQLDNKGFVSWGPRQPNNIEQNTWKTNADCCNIRNDGSWWDDDCDTPRPFICEISL